MHLKNEKNRKAFIYSRTDKSKVAEPDISAGFLFQALHLSTGYGDLRRVKRWGYLTSCLEKKVLER